MKNKFWFYYTISLVAIVVVIASFCGWWLLIRPSSVKSNCQKTTSAITKEAKATAILNIENSIKSIKVSTPDLVAAYNTEVQQQKDKENQKAATHKQLVKDYCNMTFSLYSYAQECMNQDAYGYKFAQEKPTSIWDGYSNTARKDFVDSQADIDSAKQKAIDDLVSQINPGKDEAYSFCLSVHGVK